MEMPRAVEDIHPVLVVACATPTMSRHAPQSTNATQCRSQHQCQHHRRHQHQPQPHLHLLDHQPPNVAGVLGEMPRRVAVILAVVVVVCAQLIGQRHAVVILNVLRNRRLHPHHQHHHQDHLLHPHHHPHHQPRCPYHLPLHVVLEELSCWDIWRIGDQASSGGMRTCLDTA